MAKSLPCTVRVPEYVPFAIVAAELESEGVVLTRNVPASLPLTVTLAVAL
jgi:hypothetical protein